MQSLQRQLHLGLSIALGTLLLLLWLLTSSLIERLAADLVAARLEHDTETMLAALHTQDDGLTLAVDRIPPIYRRPLSGHYYQILAGQQRLRSRSLWDSDLPTEPISPGEKRRQVIVGPGEVRLLVLEMGFRKQGGELTIAVAEELSAADRLLQRFDIAFAILTLLIVAASLLSQRFVVRRALASLGRLGAELRELEQGRIRALTESVPLEVQPLVQEVNHLLELLGQRLERSRNALGNLAHALKRPLNLLRQTLSQPAEGGFTSLRQQAEGYTEEIRTLVERELKRARLAGSATPGRHFDAAAELPLLGQVLERMHGEREIRIEFRIPQGMTVAADRDDLLELCGNLLDNACKWATRRVICTAETHAGGFRLGVEDDGPGCDPTRLAELTQRGRRLDESREGHGLGLAIVAELVELYRGELRFHSPASSGLGLRVEVELPVHVRFDGGRSGADWG